jgi:hypothetical protein
MVKLDRPGRWHHHSPSRADQITERRFKDPR